MSKNITEDSIQNLTKFTCYAWSFRIDRIAEWRWTILSCLVFRNPSREILGLYLQLSHRRYFPRCIIHNHPASQCCITYTTVKVPRNKQHFPFTCNTHMFISPYLLSLLFISDSSIILEDCPDVSIKKLHKTWIQNTGPQWTGFRNSFLDAVLFRQFRCSYNSLITTYTWISCFHL
jgi:hypothetical protein